MAEDFSRIQRIEALMQVELARLIQQELQDPRLSFVTVTGVKVSRDLSFAKVYVTTPDDTQVETMIHVLQGAAKFLRKQVAQQIKIRKMPEIRFYYDDSSARGARIAKLLND